MMAPHAHPSLAPLPLPPTLTPRGRPKRWSLVAAFTLAFLTLAWLLFGPLLYYVWRYYV